MLYILLFHRCSSLLQAFLASQPPYFTQKLEEPSVKGRVFEDSTTSTSSKGETLQRPSRFRDRYQCHSWRIGSQRQHHQGLLAFTSTSRIGSPSSCSLSTIRSQSSLTGMEKMLNRKPPLYPIRKSVLLRSKPRSGLGLLTCCESERLLFGLSTSPAEHFLTIELVRTFKGDDFAEDLSWYSLLRDLTLLNMEVW